MVIGKVLAFLHKALVGIEKLPWIVQKALLVDGKVLEVLQEVLGVVKGSSCH